MEPFRTKRTIAFVDGQSLFHRVRDCFGTSYPDYDIVALTQTICAAQGWHPVQVRFYTGLHDIHKNRELNLFWARKLSVMGRQVLAAPSLQPNVSIFTRKLLYVTESVIVQGHVVKREIAKEKGIDVRIALDSVRLAEEQSYDVALYFSQDSDLSEAANDIYQRARVQNRPMVVASAFPQGEEKQQRGIYGTTWIPFDRATYLRCIDTRDYRGVSK